MSQPGVRAALTTGPWRRRARWALRLATPWGVEWWLFTRERRRALASAVPAPPPPSESLPEAMIGFLVSRGLDEQTVRWGSMPAASLEFLAGLLFDRLPSERPVRALHVGNFVGVSLAYLTDLLRRRHPGSTVVSVDPNTTHRGVRGPQDHALALLERFGLLEHSLIIPGYTLEQTLGEAGAADEHDLLAGLACRGVLASLARLGTPAFDLVLLDGNHERDYLARELAALRPLLAPESLLVLDDIGDWPGVREVLAELLRADAAELLGQDGRVAVVRPKPGAWPSA